MVGPNVDKWAPNTEEKSDEGLGMIESDGKRTTKVTMGDIIRHRGEEDRVAEELRERHR